MRARSIVAALALASATAFAACEGNSFDAGEFSVEGDWLGRVETPVGTPPNDTVRYEIALSLTQDETTIGGTGELRAESDTVPLQVEGDWDYPSVTLTIRGAGIIPLQFSGAWDTDTLPAVPPATLGQVVTRNDSIIGTLNGSGLANVRFAIARQP